MGYRSRVRRTRTLKNGDRVTESWSMDSYLASGCLIGTIKLFGKIMLAICTCGLYPIIPMIVKKRRKK